MIEAKLSDVKIVMKENIDIMVVNHSRIERLEATTSQFKDQSKKFMKQAYKKPTSCCNIF